MLEEKNKHIRDKHISFEEGPHIYTIDGDSDFTSVTTWIHSHFHHFDADDIIKKMRASKNWPNNKYYPMEPDEIKKIWSDNGKKASADGTKMHNDIERYYNDQSVENDTIEYNQYFMKFADDHKHLTPYRTEWMIYDKSLKFAGSMDMTYINEDGTVSIYDWKRCKKIEKANGFGKFSTNEIIEDFPDSNYWHYSLQLNTYASIIERNYNLKVKDLYIVCLHPDNQNKSYLKFKVPDLKDKVALLFQEREKNIK